MYLHICRHHSHSESIFQVLTLVNSCKLSWIVFRLNHACPSGPPFLEPVVLKSQRTCNTNEAISRGRESSNCFLAHFQTGVKTLNVSTSGCTITFQGTDIA